MVIIYSEREPVIEQVRLQAHIELPGFFPSEKGIGQSHIRRGYLLIPEHVRPCMNGRKMAVVADIIIPAFTIADTKFHIINRFAFFEKIFFRQVPRECHRREESEPVFRPEARGAIGTKCSRQQVPVTIGMVDPPEVGYHTPITNSLSPGVNLLSR